MKVTDPSGALVPAARIQIIASPSGIKSETETNRQGEAVLPLNPGNYTISVRALGFKTWSIKLDLQRSTNQPITAVLPIANCCGGVTIDDPYAGLQTERQPLIASIPLEPLESLAVLPAHKTPATQPHQSPDPMTASCPRRVPKSRLCDPGCNESHPASTQPSKHPWDSLKPRAGLEGN